MPDLLRAWSRRSIAVKLPVSIGALLVVAMLAMALMAYGRVRRAMLIVADDRLLGVSQQIGGLLQGNALQRYAALGRLAHEEAIVRSTGLRDRADSAAVAALRAYVAANRGAVALDVRDTDMALRASSSDTLVTYPREDLQALARDPAAQTGATGPFRAYADTVTYPSMVPIRAGDLTAGWLVEWRRVAANPQSARELSDLIGHGAHLLVGNRAGDVWTDLAQRVAGPRVVIHDSLSRYARPDGERVIARAADVPTTAWVVVVELSEEAVVAPARRLLYEATGFALLLGLAGVIVGTLVSRRLTMPLKAVAAAATDLARGQESSRVRTGREDEIGQLEHAFNAMAEQIALGRAELATTLSDYRLLFDRNPLPMLVNDRETLAILNVNEAALRAYGYTREEFLERTLLDLHAPDEAERLRAFLTSPDYVPGAAERWTHRRRDGSLMEVEVTRAWQSLRGRPVAVALVHDVSERVAAERALAESNEALRRSQQQLLHSQKMEALGRLAGAVAHDFNNLTAAILGYAELLGASFGPDDSRRADAEEIRRAANRAAELTTRLLSFSRRQLAELRPVHLNDVVTQTERLLRRLIGEDIQLVTALDARVGTILSDPGLIEQALLNLAVNARDAMPGGGKLTIETVPVLLDETYVARHLDAKLGPHVRLAVSDTGTGIPPEVVSRVFEPFFTTKPHGQGTGLGLSTVYGIVRQSGGHVDLYTEVGRGSAFKLYFPEVVLEREARPTPAVRAAHTGGSETILLVEDDHAVRSVTLRVLEVLGYRAVEAATGASALERAADPALNIALVLTDVVMPDMSGPELAAILRERLPRARVVFMSGYTDDAVVRHGMLSADSHFLQKPFSLPQLAVKLREVLDAPA